MLTTRFFRKKKILNKILNMRFEDLLKNLRYNKKPQTCTHIDKNGTPDVGFL
jgi:hypothetical protein